MTGTAWHRLVEVHTGLALSAARRARANGQTEDLEQDARLALCDCAMSYTGPESSFPIRAAQAINRAVANKLRTHLGTSWRARSQQAGRKERLELEKLSGGLPFTPAELQWEGGQDAKAASQELGTVPFVVEPTYDHFAREEALEAEERFETNRRSLSPADRALIDQAVLDGGFHGASMSRIAIAVGEPRDAVAARLASAVSRLVR